MISANTLSILEGLEQQELHGSMTGSTVTSQTYTKLLALYLRLNDLNNAKYLWQRIPSAVKTSHNELNSVWKVGQKMWQRDVPGIYQALQEPWSNDVSEIMNSILDNTRQQCIKLVGTAYSSINLDALASFTGLSVEEAIQSADKLNWQVDLESRMVRPCRPSVSQYPVLSCEDQLHKLTDFVSFLEN